MHVSYLISMKSCTIVPQSDTTIIYNYAQYFSKTKVVAIKILVDTPFGAGASISEVFISLKRLTE